MGPVCQVEKIDKDSELKHDSSGKSGDLKLLCSSVITLVLEIQEDLIGKTADS